MPEVYDTIPRRLKGARVNFCGTPFAYLIGMASVEYVGTIKDGEWRTERARARVVRRTAARRSAAAQAGALQAWLDELARTVPLSDRAVAWFELRGPRGTAQIAKYLGRPTAADARLAPSGAVTAGVWELEWSAGPALPGEIPAR